MTTERENDPPVPARQRRRPLGWAILVVAVAVFLGASILRQVSLGGEAAQAAIARDIEALTGLPVALGPGRAQFRLLPVPRLVAESVVIGSDGEGPRLTVARLTADLDLFAALLGRVRIDRLVLLRPELSAPPGAAPDASMPDAFAPFLSRLHGLGDLEIRDGLLRRGGTGAVIVSAADLRLSWPKDGSAASLSGTYSWNGQPVRLDLVLAAPLAWLDGRPSTVDLDLTSPQLDVAFDGEASASGRLSGRVTANLPSLARTLRWLVAPRAAVPEIGPLSIVADLTADGGRLNLADASVSVDGFAGRGALDIVFPKDHRPSLSGTLAFERLDLDGLAHAVAPMPETPFEAARPIPVGFVDRLDIDLRVSAGRGRIGALDLTDLAGTVKLNDGTATLDIGDAGLLGGNGQMRVSVNTHTIPPVLKGSASMRGVDADGLLTALGLPSGAISGTADVSGSLEAPVTSWSGIVGRNRMEASLSVRSGSLAGLDPQILRSAGSGRFGEEDDTSAFAFSTMKSEIATLGPRMALTALRLSGEIGTVEGAGLLLDAAGEADLEGRFEPSSPEAAPGVPAVLTKQKPLALTMRGSWPHPAILAAPLAGGE